MELLTDGGSMGSFKRPHAFDPLDLEIIDLVYEVAWEQVSAREPARDTAQDEERQASLASSLRPRWQRWS